MWTAETGQPYWTHQTKGEIWASRFVADGKPYVDTRRRDFWVPAASKEKGLISSIELDSALSGGAPYVATLKKLYAVKTSTE